MNKKLPGSRFRVFLAVLGVCVATGIVLSYLEQGTVAGPRGETGTLEKMIVADGTVAMNVDLARLNGAKGAARPATLRFGAGPDAFFTVLIFNGELRGPQPSSLELNAQEAPAGLPSRLSESYRQLMIESTPRSEHELTVRDARTGFTFFVLRGSQFDYDASGRVFSIRDARLALSAEFAAVLGRPADAGSVVGDLALTANMRPIEVTELVNGDVKSDVLPAAGENGTNPGPDVVVGNLIDIDQFGSQSGTQVGVAIGTDSCNYGVVDLNWFALPSNDHPVIPQNLYRMSGGANNDDRFEQIGQSQMKHAFTALTGNICGLGCNGVGGAHLGSGCSDPYGAGLNAGPNLGSRAWVNPYTGVYPRGDSQTPPNNHGGHNHLGPSHRIVTEVNDLDPALNGGASYYGEAQYVTPHENTWCTANPGTCIADSGNNTFNNASYRKVSVSGSGGNFNFSWAGSTVRFQPAINAWNGATITRIVPAPGADGAAYIAYKVTNPTAGVWHYEYAIYNLNLDRAISSFTLPIGSGITKTNVGFHAPPQHPGWTFDGTVNNQGYSSTPWVLNETASSTSWSTEAFAQNPNANAVRWGTLYNIRFDSDREPSLMYAAVGFFKTGNPYYVQIQGPSSPQAPWPCTSRRRSGVPQPGCGL
jgi:hypothetical protein